MPSVEKPGSLLDEEPDRRLWKVEGDAETKVLGLPNGVGWKDMVAIVFI